MSKASQISRRSFIGAMGVASTATATSGFSFAGSAPSDQIVMGMIGVGSMGTDRLNGFLKHKDVRIAAICDVDTGHREKAIATVKAAQGHTPKGFGDFRQVLDDPEIDAVAVVTPDHWHALPTVLACQAGKDVFVEKPLSYSILEGKAMVAAAKAHGRVTQMGNHIHNDLPNYRRVVEMVKSGALGKITRVHCWKTSSTRNLGSPPDSDPPAGLDYEMWLGPAPLRSYNPLRSHGTFRYFWDYSGGIFIDFWCHITDVAFWALDLEAPLNVTATGGRRYLRDLTETPDSVEAVVEFPDLTMLYTLHPDPLPGFDHMGSIGCIFQGTEATLVTNYQGHEIYVKGKKVEDFPRPDKSIPDSPGHLREFLNAIKTRDLQTTCNIEYGLRITLPGLLSNIAFRTGQRLEWDKAKGRISAPFEANAFLGREYRKPWSMDLEI